MNFTWRRIGMILLIVGLLAFWGCSRKVNQENYKKIKIGMSYEEVTAIVGEPVACESVLGVQSCDWGDETRAINIKFAADNVVFRSAKGLL
jgi:hypothetical protein